MYDAVRGLCQISVVVDLSWASWTGSQAFASLNLYQPIYQSNKYLIQPHYKKTTPSKELGESVICPDLSLCASFYNLIIAQNTVAAP